MINDRQLRHHGARRRQRHVGDKAQSRRGIVECDHPKLVLDLRGNHNRFFVIARRESAEAIQFTIRGYGLLRGACHRAGHFGPDPLARNDERHIGL